MSVASVCIYCGSNAGNDPRYEAVARDLGRGLAARSLGMVFGGGRVGLMGAVADATLEGGGTVVGIIPEHLRALEVQHQGVSELVVVSSMHERKALMCERADAFVALPGGLGTLDETFEILTWRQLGLHDKPVILANIHEFWTPLIGLIDHCIGSGFARPAHRDLFTVANTLDEVFEQIAAAPEARFDPRVKWT